ncbi:hypothetical protein KUCAC02_017155 [Chaenocephalus aceratus]|uniref:Uncharacterized protein n=1 Tax=Chaenocephalus aceratus TaxID=36190 RepID=A0ACB9W0Y1_CHAAC|nr:hypothetical protein KUCAC02_017155 [Chaenocephalus aceratus]
MNTSEGETQSFSDSHHENIIFATFYILIFLIAVPGNALALWAFFRQHSTSPSKVFLRHLSVADLSYILMLPMRIVYHLSDSHWPFGHVVCRLAGFLFYLNMYCSLYLMSFISLHRFLAVVLPITSQSVRKVLYAKQKEERPVKTKAIRMIVLIVMNFLFAFVPYHVSRVVYIEMHMHGNLTAASHESLGRANRITSALTCVSGVLDPVMYFFLNRVYRDTLLQLFCKP